MYSLSGEDVTQEFTDLGSRLRNLEATEVELLALLTECASGPAPRQAIFWKFTRSSRRFGTRSSRSRGACSFCPNLTSLATIQVELIPDALYAPVIEEAWAACHPPPSLGTPDQDPASPGGSCDLADHLRAAPCRP